MCSNRIEEKTDLRSFHLGQDISIPYLKIYTLHPYTEINVLTLGFKKKKHNTKHSHDRATEPLDYVKQFPLTMFAFFTGYEVLQMSL